MFSLHPHTCHLLLWWMASLSYWVLLLQVHRVHMRLFSSMMLFIHMCTETSSAFDACCEHNWIVCSWQANFLWLLCPFVPLPSTTRLQMGSSLKHLMTFLIFEWKATLWKESFGSMTGPSLSQISMGNSSSLWDLQLIMMRFYIQGGKRLLLTPQFTIKPKVCGLFFESALTS